MAGLPPCACPCQPWAAPDGPNLRTGFEQLVRLDERFRAYANTLFGASQLDGGKDRDQYTQQEAEAVDRALARCLDLLSPFVLRPAAFNILEYLVRRFRCGRRLVGLSVRFGASRAGGPAPTGTQQLAVHYTVCAAPCHLVCRLPAGQVQRSPVTGCARCQSGELWPVWPARLSR